ncbi:MAG: ferredoxin-thioredoxin reductase catalytic domain-containing protein [Candidatus Helarchaeota archaeon]
MVDIDDIRNLVKKNAERKGWILNKDVEWVEDLIQGLFKNIQRYGYPSCPCRLSVGVFEKDKDLICPCDYAPADIEEYGHCYCALFFKKEFFNQGREQQMIPERRPKEKFEYNKIL